MSTDLTRRLLMAGMTAATAGGASLARAAEGKIASVFPKDFLWGAATAGHQVEGNNVNSDIWQLEQLKPGPFKEPSGDACDHYHLFEQDIALLAGLGLNTYRFSLEWARIEPEKGLWSAAEMRHYVAVAEACHSHGVTPVVTFNHYTVPRWFAAQGGFENPESADLFAGFCARAASEIGHLIGVACTFNEPNLPMVLRSMLPPFIIADMSAALKAAAKRCASDRFSTIQFADPALITPNLVAAHRKSYAALKAGPGKYPVGASLAMLDEQAFGPGSKQADVREQLYGVWLRSLADCGDFVGVQTYSRRRIGADGPLPPPAGVELTQMGEEFYPEAIGGTIRYAHTSTGKPVYVTENGVATEDDTRRVAYIERAMRAVEACIRDGVPVRSYIHWSLLDNFEWVAGYGPKFGLVAVDRATQKRTPKPSAAYLCRIARAGGV